MARAHRRRNYLIAKSFQLKYTLMITGLLLATILVIGAGVYMGMWGSIIENFSKFRVSEQLEGVRKIADSEGIKNVKVNYDFKKMYKEGTLLSERQKQELKSILKDINKNLLPKVLFLAAAILIAGIFISHKIAGPVYKIEKSAEAVRRGDLRVDFKIRNTDELGKAAFALEEMVKSLHGDVRRMKETAKVLGEKVNALAGRLPDEERKHLKTLVDEVCIILSRYTI